MPSSIPKLLTIFVIALPLVFGSYFIFQNSSFPEVKGIAVKKLGISTTEKSSNSTPKTSFIPNKKVDLPILMYHHVRNMNEKEAKNKIQYDLTVSPAILEKQVQKLKEKGYNTVTSYQIADYLKGQKELPKNPIMLTFDDGYKDNFDNALPILEKYGYKADIAILTGANGGEFMNWDELAEVVARGHGISSHTIDHCPMTLKNADGTFSQNTPVDTTYKPCSRFGIDEKLTAGQVAYEMQESKKTLESKLGITVSHLVYPFGKWNATSERIAKESGYLFATTTQSPKSSISDFENDTFGLPRYRVHGQQSGELDNLFTKVL